MIPRSCGTRPSLTVTIPRMSDEVPRYELDILRWHKDRPRQESDNDDRKDSQLWLALVGYLTRGDDGRYSITTKGLKYLRETK